MAAIQRILITGADGFVGSWLIKELRSRFPAAELFGTSLAVPQMENLQGFACDVRDGEAVERLVADVNPDALVHLAAIASVTQAQDSPRMTWSVNLMGTLNFAEAVLKHQPDARFVFAGSAESYGATFARWPRPLDEDAPLSPNNPYAASKAAADLALGALAAQRGLHAVRFRPFNHVGTGQDERFVIPAFASQIAKIEAGKQDPVLRVGDLRACREFLDVRDVVRGYVDALATPEPLEDGIVLNLSTGAPIAIGDVLDSMIEMSPRDIAIEIDPALVRGEETPFAGGDATRAKTELGWEPDLGLQEALRSVLDHYRVLHGQD